MKKQFIDWIDTFTNKFVKSLSKIEQSKELAAFHNEDSKMTAAVNEIRASYFEIIKMFTNIARAEPADKLAKIEKYRQYMK